MLWNYEDMYDRKANLTMRFASTNINDFVTVDYNFQSNKKDHYELGKNITRWFGGSMISVSESMNETSNETLTLAMTGSDKHYLLLNTEFLFDTNLVGVEVNAANNGSVLVQVRKLTFLKSFFY